MDDLDRAIQNAARMRDVRKRLNELKENIAAWAGGGLRIDRRGTNVPSDEESVTSGDVTNEDPLLQKK